MASPFDTLLQQVKNKLSSATQFIGGGALQGAQKIQQNFQPQIISPIPQSQQIKPVDNRGIWANPVGIGMAQAQNKIQGAYNNPVVQQSIKNSVPWLNPLNPFRGFTEQLVPTAIQTGVNAGLEKITGNPMTFNVIPRSTLESYSSGGQLGKAQPILTGGLQTLNAAMGALSGPAMAANPLNYAKTTALWNTALQGTGEIAKGIREGKSAKEIIKNTLKASAGQGTTSGPLGGIFGESGLTQAADMALSIGLPLVIRGKTSELITKKEQIKQLRDARGKWIEGTEPIKPKGFTDSQWKFQLEFNKKYNRNPYEMVTNDNLRQALKIEAEKRIGMQARPVQADTIPSTGGEIGGKKTYQIAEPTGMRTVQGEPVKIADGLETFLRAGDNGHGYAVSEVSTGRLIAVGETKANAVAKAKSTINDVGLEKTLEYIKKYQPSSGEIPKVPSTGGEIGGTNKKGIVQAGNTYADLHGVDPEQTITVYRGVKESQHGKLSGGEWVTQDKELARLYSRDRARASGENARIISQKVKAKDLIIDPSTNPGVDNEFRFQPSTGGEIGRTSREMQNRVQQNIDSGMSVEEAVRKAQSETVIPSKPKPINGDVRSLSKISEESRTKFFGNGIPNGFNSEEFYIKRMKDAGFNQNQIDSVLQRTPSEIRLGKKSYDSDKIVDSFTDYNLEVRSKVSGDIPKVPSTGGEIGSKAQFKQPIKVPEQPRGFTESVQQAENIPKRVKGMVQSVYVSKPNSKLMGEAQALLQEGASLDITKVQNVDQKIAATIQEAINQQRKNPDLAANLYNNLARQGTELGRGVQAYSLLQKMTPEAIAKSAAGKIQEYNRTAVRKIPELTGDQLKLITAKVDALKKLPIGSRERNIAVNELSNVVNSFIPSSVADKAITVWKAGLLTSLRTTERNLFGNTIHGAIEAIKDLPATQADMLMSMATGKRTITPTVRGVSEAWSKKTAQQISDTIKLGYDATEDISKYDIKRVNWANTPIQQALKKYTDIVFRSLGAQDKPFYNAAFKRSLFSQAGAEAINVGRGGDRSFIQHLVNNPTEDMVKLAISDANVATFKDKNMASAIASKIKRALEEGVTIGDKKYQSEILRVASDVFLPFTGVPSSIFGQIANYSPVGLLKGIVNTGKVLSSQVPDLQRQAAQEIGRGVIGTGIYGLGAYLASKGLITGQPKDAEEQRQWDLENKPRNSIMIGGKWRSLNSIGPEAVVFLAGAKLNEEMKNPEGSVGGYAGTLAKDYLDQSFVQGLQQPVNVITDPTRYGKSYAGNMIASFVPNIVKDYAKSQDPYQRETNTIGDYAKAAIPGLRNTLIEKRDVLGNVMKQEPTGLGAFFDLFNSKTPVDNAVVSELSRLQKEGEGATPSKLTPQQTILKQKVKLTFEQLNQLEQGVGEIVRPRLETLIQSPVYQQLDDEHKAKAIDSIVNDARLKYKNINAKTLTGAGLNPNQYLDVNGNLKTVSTEPIPEPKLTGNKVIDDKLKASYKTAVQNQQMEQYKLATQTTPTLEKKTYDYIDENGNYKTVDLTPVKFPEMTGNTVIDKKLVSAYNSQINAQINDVIKLNQAGQITQKEMINMVNSLNAQYKKNKSIGGLKPRLKIRKLPKLKALKVKKAKKIKVPKLARINIKPLKGV